MQIEIDNRKIETTGSEPLIEVARGAGITIPTLCYYPAKVHKASCMACAVRNIDNNQIVPSCTTVPAEGLKIDTASEEIKKIRRLSVELLLSDHRAECEARCTVACPAGLDVARMNRLYDKGLYDQAARHLIDSLVIPATLCYLCPAPCEKVCRRGEIEKAVEIRQIKKRLIADFDVSTLEMTPRNGKTIAVLGSDPVALVAAYTLAINGFAIDVFEEGGTILNVDAPRDIIEKELKIIASAGVNFHTNSAKESFDGYDTVISTIPERREGWVIFESKIKQQARLTALGRELAYKIINPSYTPKAEYNSTFGKLTETEKSSIGLSTTQSGCLWCDCEKKSGCRLRDAATHSGIKSRKYNPTDEKGAMERVEIGGGLRFEPAKCISCGLCVYNSSNGFTFRGRGYDMDVMLPAENIPNLPRGLEHICPTGAISTH